MTKAQQTYERINALVDGGMQKAAAFKQLAEEYGQPVDSVRGAYYGHKRVLERGDEPGTGAGSRSSGRRSRKRETTTQDAVASRRGQPARSHRLDSVRAGDGSRAGRRGQGRVRGDGSGQHGPDRGDPVQDRRPRPGGQRAAGGHGERRNGCHRVHRRDRRVRFRQDPGAEGDQGLVGRPQRQMARDSGLSICSPESRLLTPLSSTTQVEQHHYSLVECTTRVPKRNIPAHTGITQQTTTRNHNKEVTP